MKFGKGQIYELTRHQKHVWKRCSSRIEGSKNLYSFEKYVGKNVNKNRSSRPYAKKKKKSFSFYIDNILIKTSSI